MKGLTKVYVDSESGPEYKICSPYAPFLAWAQQFVVYCKYAVQLDKVQKQIKALEKELEERQEKYTSLKNIVDSFTKDGYLALFEREIREDEERINRYELLEEGMIARAKDEQAVYLNFEKRFFQELEQFVIKKKMASSISQKGAEVRLA